MGCGASAKQEQTRRVERDERLSKIAEAVRAVIDGKTDGNPALSRKEKVALCFKEWDVDSNGGISANELLKIIVVHCGVAVDMKDIRPLWSQTDLDLDTQITLDEFYEWLYRDPENPTPKSGLPRSPSGSWPARAPQKSFGLGGTESLLRAPRYEPLIVFLHSAVELPSGARECSPEVVAFVTKGGNVVGPQVTWPAFRYNNNPCWNTARDLGCHKMGLGADEKSVLHLEVRVIVEGMFTESHVLLGEVCLGLADLRPDDWEYQCLRSPAGTRLSDDDVRKMEAAKLRFMIMSEPPLVKKIFVVRHAESEWNKAQKEKNISALLAQVDHPLTDDGLKQCLNLQEKISRLCSDGGGRAKSHSEVELLDAQLVLSSPLTRAVETALIALQPILANLKLLRLMANAREKRNRGGRDTTGAAKGVAEIFYRLRQVLSDHGISEEKTFGYLSVDVDSTEADNKWWNDSKESSSAVQERLNEFLRQLRYLREERIIVVGHSHFYREMLKQRLHSSASIVDPNNKTTRSDVYTKKLENCGVMAITLDFRKGSDRPITEVELMLDTIMVH